MCHSKMNLKNKVKEVRHRPPIVGLDFRKLTIRGGISTETEDEHFVTRGLGGGRARG